MLSIVVCVAIALIFNSCEKESFDEALLIGKWKMVGGTEYYKYLADHTGATWDPADDVTEEEAQTFTWSLNGSELTLIHNMEIKGVPKVYTLTKLTSSTLEFKDSFSNSYTYSKVTK